MQFILLIYITPGISQNCMSDYMLIIVELAMKSWSSHCCSWETLVSKPNHKNVAALSIGSRSGWNSDHATLLSRLYSRETHRYKWRGRALASSIIIHHEAFSVPIHNTSIVLSIQGLVGCWPLTTISFLRARAASYSANTVRENNCTVITSMGVLYRITIWLWLKQHCIIIR